MAEKISRFFDVTLTQGSADAFVEGSISTGIVPANGVGLKIVKVEMMKSYMPMVTGADRTWSISRDTKLAVASYDDPDCFYADGERVNLSTNGAFLYRFRDSFSIPEGIFVVEPVVYLQLDSTSTAVVNNVKFRLFYEDVKLSEVEILRLLNNS